MTGDAVHAAGRLRAARRRSATTSRDSRRSSRCRCRSRTASATSRRSTIEQSLPDAVGAFIDWLVNESGWKVTERPATTGAGRARTSASSSGASSASATTSRSRTCRRSRRAASSTCSSAARPSTTAKKSRRIRAALAAIEWPDDELSVFATLRGALFAIGDEELLEWKQRFGAFHPFRIHGARRRERGPPITCSRSPTRCSCCSACTAGATTCPVAETIQQLLDATRAHVGVVLRSAGEQALANVLHVAELARAVRGRRRHVVPRLRRRAARWRPRRRRPPKRRSSKRAATASA